MSGHKWDVLPAAVADLDLQAAGCILLIQERVRTVIGVRAASQLAGDRRLNLRGVVVCHQTGVVVVKLVRKPVRAKTQRARDAKGAAADAAWAESDAGSAIDFAAWAIDNA